MDDVMPAARGRSIVLLSGLLGLTVLAVAGFALKDRFVEEYWLRQFERGNGGEREVAVRRLGELRSVRAVPGLLTWVGSAKGEGEDSVSVISSAEWPSPQEIFTASVSKAVFDAARSAFMSIGPGAVPRLTELSGEQNGDPSVRFWAKAMLGELKGEPRVLFLKGHGYSAIPSDQIGGRDWVGK